jgi:hypothetical protein
MSTSLSQVSLNRKSALLLLISASSPEAGTDFTVLQGNLNLPADDVYYRVNMDFTGVPVIGSLRVDALSGWRCGGSQGDCHRYLAIKEIPLQIYLFHKYNCLYTYD